MYVAAFFGIDASPLPHLYEPSRLRLWGGSSPPSNPLCLENLRAIQTLNYPHRLPTPPGMIAEPRSTVLAVVGLHGSGKTTIASHLASKGWATVATGSVIRAEARKRGLSETWENLQRISMEFFEHRQHTIIPALEATIRRELTSSGKVAVDGVKTTLELSQLQTICGRCFSLAVLSSPQTRLERLAKRARADDVPDPDRLKDRDAKEIAHGLGFVIARSDFFASNDGSSQSLALQVDTIVDALGME